MVLRSRASVSLQEEDASHRDKRQRTSVISSITNCGTFMHIIALTYSWIKLQEKEAMVPDSIKYVGLQANLDKVRLMLPADFFNLIDGNLKRPESLQDATSMCLRCYGITKPKKEDQKKYVTIAHYFAVLTDGETGVLYNAYGSDETKNPGYSMEIDLVKFFKFIKAMNSKEGSAIIKRNGYNDYFLRNEIDYFDDDDGCIVKVGDRDEYTKFVLTETDLKIYEIENYQENVQKKLSTLITLIKATEPPAIEKTVTGGKTPKRNPKRKQKRKSKRKRRSRRTRRRKRTKTRRRRKK
jgi:hypothetical protein